MSLSPATLRGSKSPTVSLARLPGKLHWVFLLLASPLVIFLAVWTPPFQSADEAAHFERAYLVAHGNFFGGLGGNIDTGVDQLYAYVSKLPLHPDARFTSADRIGAAEVQWVGHSTFHGFPNIATCAPTGYIPQTLAIITGQAAGLGVQRTLILARLFNGAASIILCTLALCWCRSGKVVMFAVLLFPMTLSLFASASQDATLIALTCVALALVSRSIAAGTPISGRETAILVASLLIVSVGRPPYACLLLVLLTSGLLRRWRKWPSWVPGLCFAGLSAAAAVGWWLAEHASTGAFAYPTGANGVVDARMQILNVLHHPSIVWGIASYVASHIPEYTAELIGYLGWLDTLMPPLYYLIFIVVLLTAVIAELAQGQRIARSATATLLFASCASVAAVFAIEYLIWTPVGAAAVYGVQGRYAIPLAIVAGVGLPRQRQPEKTFEWATAIVVAAQIITVVVLPRVILARYYIG